ncbi:VTT domain-containing protein [Thermogladius sp. 4427co]|uniref:VTT domain-containing protein n=1 Tax=Thermogladius sp. 4427co TaxID=3450718 RepID=UPI003F78FC07
MVWHSLARDVVHSIMVFLSKAGLYGVFIVSLASNAIPFVAIPYLVFVILYTANIHDARLLFLTALASGVGAGVGKLVVYFVGRGVASLRPTSTTFRNWQYLGSRHRLAGFIAIFLIAVTPAPDDIVLIPMGIASYNIILYSIAVFTGKIIHSLLAVIYGKTVLLILEERLGLELWESSLILLILTIIIVYLIGQVDWARVAEAYGEEGFKRSMKIVLSSLVEAVVKPFRAVCRWLKKLM